MLTIFIENSNVGCLSVVSDASRFKQLQLHYKC